jgi:hypothetical protein
MLSLLCAYLDLAPTAVKDIISRAQSEYIRVKQALWQVVLACFDDVTCQFKRDLSFLRDRLQFRITPPGRGALGIDTRGARGRSPHPDCPHRGLRFRAIHPYAAGQLFPFEREEARKSR